MKKKKHWPMLNRKLKKLTKLTLNIEFKKKNK